MTDLLNILLPTNKISLKIGLFFGSFNPIHIGHMAIANFMVEFAGIDQLWFVVSPQNPLKQKDSLLNDYQRLEMVRMAVDDDPRFRVSDAEFKLAKPSYTIDTLVFLAQKFPNHHFTLILGADNLVNFPNWKNYQSILDNYGIIVYPRPGFDTQSVVLQSNISVVKAPLMEISSTFIRDGIKSGKNLRHFLPCKVSNYIEEMGNYK